MLEYFLEIIFSELYCIYPYFLTLSFSICEKVVDPSTRRSPIPFSQLFVATDPFTSTSSSSNIPPLPNTVDPHVLLRLDPNAQHSKTDMKRAYRQMALLYHPDVRLNASSSKQEREVATEDFARINAAYNFLTGKSDDPTGKTGYASEQKKRKKREEEMKAQTQSRRASPGVTQPNKQYGYSTGYAGYGRSYGGSPAPPAPKQSRPPPRPAPSTVYASNGKKSMGAKSYWERHNGNGVGSSSTSASTHNGGTNYGAAYGAAYSSPSSFKQENRAPAAARPATSVRQQAAKRSANWNPTHKPKASFETVNRATSNNVNYNTKSNWSRDSMDRNQTGSRQSAKTMRPSQSKAQARATAQATAQAQARARIQPKMQKQTTSQTRVNVSPEQRRQWGDFFDAEKFHSQWNSSAPNRSSQSHNTSTSVNANAQQKRGGNGKTKTEAWDNLQGTRSQSVGTKAVPTSQVRSAIKSKVIRKKDVSSKADFESRSQSVCQNDATSDPLQKKSYGDFFDAERFHSQWNSFEQSPPASVQDHKREQQRLELKLDLEYARKIQEKKKLQEVEEKKIFEKQEKVKAKLTKDLRNEIQKKKAPNSSSGWNGFVQAVTTFFQPLADENPAPPAKKKTFTKPTKKASVSVLSPPRGHQFSPYEACSILKQHDIHPDLDKPAAMRIMLEKHYVPVKRSQLYRVYRLYKEGKIASDHRWGQYQ